MPYRRSSMRALFMVLVAVLMTAACSTPQLPGPTRPPPTPKRRPNARANDLPDNSARVVDTVSSAVLNTVLGPSPVPQGTGSGFVYDSSDIS